MAASLVDRRPGRRTADERVHGQGPVRTYAVEEVVEVLQITVRED
jgi:hypothetical protein